MQECYCTPEQGGVNKASRPLAGQIFAKQLFGA
jgi:hypothetical protein